MENSGLNPGDFLIVALAAGPIKCCSMIAELRWCWWVKPFLTNNFAVATPMNVCIVKIQVWLIVSCYEE